MATSSWAAEPVPASRSAWVRRAHEAAALVATTALERDIAAAQPVAEVQWLKEPRLLGSGALPLVPLEEPCAIRSRALDLLGAAGIGASIRDLCLAQVAVLSAASMPLSTCDRVRRTEDAPPSVPRRTAEELAGADHDTN